MPTKTSELIGPALDLAVANAVGMSWWLRGKAKWDHHAGYTDWILDTDGVLKRFRFNESTRAGFWEEVDRYTPSTDWSQAGPLIEELDIDVLRDHDEDGNDNGFGARLAKPRPTLTCPAMLSYAFARGPTRLIAAMRCYVRSKLGEEIDLNPKESA